MASRREKVAANEAGQYDLSAFTYYGNQADAVCVFAEKRATRFLEKVKPDIYVKGGDYTLETLDADERQAVLSHVGSIVFIPFLEGRSTTQIIHRIG